MRSLVHRQASLLYARIYDGKVDDYRFGTKLEEAKSYITRGGN